MRNQSTIGNPQVFTLKSQEFHPFANDFHEIGREFSGFDPNFHFSRLKFDQELFLPFLEVLRNPHFEENHESPLAGWHPSTEFLHLTVHVFLFISRSGSL